MKLENYHITKVDLHELSDDQLNELFDFKDITFRWYEEDDPLPDREQRFYVIRNRHPHYDEQVWIVRNDKQQIIATGAFEFETKESPSFEQNGHTIGIDIEVLPKYRRQGLATKLLKLIIDEAVSMQKTVAHIGSSIDSGVHFIEDYLGGKVGQQGGENRLYLNEVDWKMIDEWIEEGEKRNPNTELFLFEDCPADIIDEYMKIYTETMNQQPLGEMEWNYKGTPESRRMQEKRYHDLDMKWYTLVTKETDGRITGLTEIFYNPTRTFRLAQNLTGVKKEERGRGLGKWLKASMLRRMYEIYPDIVYITTGNADSNAPMLSINRRMGFKKKRSFKGYKFQIKDLQQKLK